MGSISFEKLGLICFCVIAVSVILYSLSDSTHKKHARAQQRHRSAYISKSECLSILRDGSK